MFNKKMIFALLGFFAVLTLLAIFWGCQQGAEPSSYGDWQISSIYSQTGIDSLSDGSYVFPGISNIICSYIYRVEGEKIVPIPTNMKVYFIAIAETVSSSMSTGPDTILSGNAFYPAVPGTVCTSINLRSNTTSLAVIVTVVDEAVVSKTQYFVAFNGTRTITLEIEHNEVSIDSGNIWIKATTLNEIGSPIVDEPVCFASSDHNIGVIADSCLFTDALGQCQTNFVIGTHTGIDTIYATDSYGNYDFKTIIVSPAAANSGSLSADRYHIFRCGLGLFDQVNITAHIYDRYWNPVKNGTEVIFKIDDFTNIDSCSSDDSLIDGCYRCPHFEPQYSGSDPDSIMLYSDKVMTVDGIATVKLKAGTLPGVVDIRAIILDGSGIEFHLPEINISSGAPHYISLSARIPGSSTWEAGDPLNGYYSTPLDNAMWGACTQDSIPLELMAIVSDEYHNPIPGVSVWFTTTSGVVGGWPGSPSIAENTDSTGIAHSYWFSSDRRELDSCIVQIKAFTSDTSVENDLFFYLRYDDGAICCNPCENLAFDYAIAVPETIDGTGVDSTDISVRLLYTGMPMVDFPVYFFASRGWLSSYTDSTDDDGVATVKYSAINPTDAMMTQTITIITSDYCETTNVVVYIRPAAVDLNIVLTADDYNPSVGGQQVNLYGFIRDPMGDPLTVPLPIEWFIDPDTLDLGTLIDYSTYSDTLGTFGAVFQTSSDAGLIDICAIIAGSETVCVSLNVVPAVVNLIADDYNPIVGGQIVHLSGTVRDLYGAPITIPQPVIWHFLTPSGGTLPADMGALDSLSFYTDTLGNFGGIFTTNTAIGSVMVIADVDDIGSDTLYIVIHSGLPASINLTVSPDIDTAGGLVPDTIYGCITDEFGNPVEFDGIVDLWLSYNIEGDSICSPCLYGSIEPTSVIPDSAGCFTALFSPGTMAGIIWIQAQADSARGATYITISPQLARYESLAVVANHIRTCGNPPYQTQIIAYIYDQFGNPVSDLTPVIFAIDTFTYMDACTVWDDSCLSPCPRLVPQHPTLGPLDSDTLLTTDGVTQVTLKSGSFPGVVRVAAYVLDGSGEMATSEMINISSGNIGILSISARRRSDIDEASGTPCLEVPPYTCEYCNWGYNWWSGDPDMGGYAPQLNLVGAWNMDGDTCNGLWLQVRISATDSFGNPIPNATVFLSCDEGLIGGFPYGLTDTTELTDSFGLAYSYWYASDPRIDGATTIKVSAATPLICDSLWFYMLDTLGIPPYDTVQHELIYAIPDTIFGDGMSTVDIMFRVTRDGNPVPNYPVYLRADSGSVISPVLTDSIGYARTTYYSALNHHMSPPIITEDAIMAIAGVDTVYFSIFLLPVDPILPYVAYILLYLEPENIAVGDTTVLTGLILDGMGFPVRLPIPVHFALRVDGAPAPLGMGMISPSYTYTSMNPDSSGYFHSVFRSGTQAGDLWIVVQAEDVSESLLVHINGGSPQNVVVIPEDTLLEADNRSSISITATVTDIYSNPVEGASVEFSTTLGQIAPTPVVTGSDGTATTVLTSGTITGLATITASCEGRVGTASVNFVSAAVHFILLDVSPNRIIADGTSTANVTADVRDQYGQPIADGTMVSFRCLDTLGSPVGTIDTIGTTSGGIATITLTAPTTSGNAWVFATAMGHSDSAAVQFIPGEIHTMTLDAYPDSIPADGVSRSTLTAQCFDEFGNPVGSGSRIDFSTDLGTLIFDHAFTNDSGVAEVPLESPRETGTAHITASVSGAEANAEVVFTSLNAANVIVTADTVVLPADGMATTTIRAIALDSTGASVADGTPIFFSTDMGIVIPGVSYTVSGEADVTLRSSTTPGVATIVARASASVAGTTYVEFVAGGPAQITMDVTPDILPANGDTTAIITGTVLDANDNPVDAGIAVHLSTSLGSVDTVAYTDTTGAFTAIFYAGITPGTAIIIAQCEGAVAQAFVDLVPTNVGIIYILVDPNELTADSRSEATVSGRVTNLLGTPIADGTPVHLEVICTDTLGCSGYGEVVPITAHTDSGNFSATFIAGTKIGRVYIIASVDTITDTTFIDLVPGEADSIDISANPNPIAADSFSTSTISATLYDRYGNRLGSGITVNFSTTLGEISPTTTTTNSAGTATASLLSGRNAGVARVRAESGTAVSEIEVTFNTTDVALVVVSSSPGEITADGTSTSLITAQVSDTLGNPVSDGTPVMFTQIVDTAAGEDTLGLLMPLVGFTDGGAAAVQFRSGMVKGRATIQACVDTTHCGITFVDLLAGQADSIYLVAGDSTLPADGVSITDITATVFDRYGNSVESGRSVTTGATLGTLNPTTGATNSSGQYTTILTSADTPGLSRITAQCEDAYATVDVIFGMTPPVYLSIHANPSRIAADGVSTSTITAHLINSTGGPVLDGTMIIFHALDAGGAPFGDIDTIATTVDGDAVVTLTAPTTTGTTFVSASYFGDSDTLTDTTLVIFQPGNPAAVYVNAYPGTLYANDTLTARITIVVVDEFGNMVGAGHTVTIETDNGDIFPQTGYTGDTIVCTYFPGSSAGRAVITATTGSISGVAVIELLTQTIAEIAIYADSAFLTANGLSTTPIHIVAQDSMGHPVADGTPLFITTSAGVIFPGVIYTTGGEGTATLRSGTYAPDTAVVVVVAGAISDTLRLPFVPGSPALINVFPARNILWADGEDTTMVRVYITDIHGNWINVGQLVNFSTNLGTIDTFDVTHAVAETTGYAEAMFRSGIEAGAALITVSCGDAVGTGRITLDPTNVGEIAIFADPDIIVADGHTTSSITGYVRNTLGNPIAEGTQVRLGVNPDSLGNISPATAYTDSGNFSATFTAATSIGSVWVWMEVGGVRDSVMLELISGQPHTIVMTPIIGTIPADSATVDTIAVTVYDRYGNRVEGGIDVDFTTGLGEVFPPMNETNNAGSTYVFIRSGYQTGVARVVGRVSDYARGECSIVFTTTQATTVYLTAEPHTIMADGYSTISLSAVVLDSTGHPISDGTPVIFSVSNPIYGMVIPGIGYTVSGEATSTFRTAVQKGNPVLRAETDSLHFDEVTITLTAGDPANVVLTVNPDTISANGMDESSLSAYVYDEWGNAVDAGKSVSFSSTLGDILFSPVLTDDTGNARTVLRAGNVPGDCQVSALCGGIYDVNDVYFRQSTINTIIMSVDPPELTADGISSAAVTAQAFDAGGSPVTDNTRIYYWVQPPTSGTIISPRFTSGGTATTEFRVETDVGNGFAWLFAADTLPPGNTVTDSVRVTLRPGEPAYIFVWMDSSHTPPGTLFADGNDGEWIYAQVFDAYGNHVLGGRTVSFQTTIGTFSPTSSMTDTAGLTMAFLQSGLTPGTASLSVTCGSAMGFLGVEMIETSIADIWLTADKTVLTADGEDMANITAMVYAPGGTPVSDGAVVHFFAESSFVHILPEVAYTDSGTAMTSVVADTVARSSVRVYAYATIGSDTSDTASLNFRVNPGEPARMVISPAPSDSATIPADGASGVEINVWVYDQYSNPISAGSTVRFATTLGNVTDVGFTDLSGHSSALLTAGTITGNAVITITAGTITGYTQVNFYELLTDLLIMTVIPNRLTADGISTATITVHAYDSAGFPASDGSRIELTQHDTTGGFAQGVIAPHIAYTADGYITATLNAPLHTGSGRIYAYADTAGSAVVDSFDVQYIAGSPAIIVFDTTGFGNFMADGRYYSVPVYAYDAYNNPVDLGTEITFSTTLGEIQTPAVVSNDSGKATTYIMSHETGPAVITAHSGDAVATASCSFSEIEGDWMSLIANPYLITADGSSQSIITATLMDTSSGMFVPVSDGVPVQFQVSGPGFISPSVSFTSDGQVSATLTAGTYADTAFVVATGPITVTGDTLKDTVKVFLSPGPPAIAEFVPSYLHNLPANGADTMLIWVHIMDAFGNSIVSGTPVSFSINLGNITPNSATNDSGCAWGIITSSLTPGVATISATCQSASGYATIAMQQLVADSIILAVYPNEITADGASTSELTAVVFDSTGLPVSDGTIVRFSASRGLTNPSIAYTSAGVATSNLIASVTPDTVFVAAISGAVADTDTVYLVPGPPSRMTMWSTPDSVLVANGGDTARIWVEVRDDYNNLEPAGELVSFSSSIGIINPTAYTNSVGQASVILSSEYSIGWGLISATCGGASGSMLIQFIPDSIGMVILAVNPIQLVADGSSTADITVTVLDINDHPIADGTPVLFSGMTTGIPDPPLVTTTGGSASATLRALTIVGMDTLIASTGLLADSITVSFVAGPPANIILTPDTNYLVSDGADTTSVFAYVTDAAGNPVEDGTVVHFSVDPSDIGVVWEVGVTASAGSCRTVFRAGTHPGVVAVHATSGSANGTAIIELVPPNVASIELSVEDHYLPGDGISNTNTIAMVFDTLGLPAPNGTGVHFTITSGSVPANLFPGWAQTTDGVAQVQLIAPTNIGVCSVYAYIDTGGAVPVTSDTEVVYFEGGDPQVILFSPTTLTLPADGATDTVCTLSVLDRYGNPIGALPVTMTLDLGNISPAIVVTDTSGKGTFRIVSSRNIGDGVVTATASPAVGYMNVHYEPVAVDTILLFATPSILPADGTSQSTITAIVLDSLGRLASNGIGVFFFTTDGYITPYDTTAGGQATAVITAIDTATVVTVTAVCDPETAAVQVTFTAGVPDTVMVYFSQGLDTVGSGSIDSIYGQVLDTLGNPVGEGSLVELWLADDAIGLDTCGAGGEPCSLGTIADITVLTDATGSFSTQFTPGTKSGIVWIHAKSADAYGRDYMILDPEIAHTESLDVDRNQIYVRGSGNIDQAVLTAHIYDRYNNPVRDSTKVIFYCTNYPGGADPNKEPSLEPQHPTLGQLWSDTIYTLNGRGNVTIRSGKASGVIIVRSSVLDGSGIISEAPRITVASGLPYNISISRSDCNVPGWLIDGLPDTVMVIVSDSMENPCPNVAVYFTTEEGIVTGAATTDSVGYATGIWYSADPRDDGIVWVHARTRGDSSASCHGSDGWVCDSVWFYNSGPASAIAISASPASLNADGTATSIVTAILTDDNGNPVKDSTQIDFDVDVGTITTPVNSYNECYGSRAEATYTSATVDVDDYCANSQVALATISGQANFAFSSTTINLMGSNCNSDNSSINAPDNVPWGGDFTVVVNVKDLWNNPICGDTVTLTSALGATIADSPGITNDMGDVSFTVTASNDSVPDLITASFGECAVWANVTYTPVKMLMRTSSVDTTADSNVKDDKFEVDTMKAAMPDIFNIRNKE